MSNYLKSGDFIGGSKFLNDVKDSVASGQPDAMGVLPGTAYGGGLNQGDYLRLTDVEALALSDTTTGTLYGGIYRRVLFKAGITGGGNTGFKRGQIVFWDFPTSGADPYQVTNVEATDPYLYAGVVINATDTSTAPLSGFYGWIQVAGTATGQYKATVSSAGANLPAIWAKAGAGADNAQWDTIAIATDVTAYSQVMAILGISVDASTNGGTGRILLNGTMPLARI
jgi:hypothetical protein